MFTLLLLFNELILIFEFILSETEIKIKNLFIFKLFSFDNSNLISSDSELKSYDLFSSLKLILTIFIFKLLLIKILFS